jgi:hypothetical protein
MMRGIRGDPLHVIFCRYQVEEAFNIEISKSYSIVQHHTELGLSDFIGYDTLKKSSMVSTKPLVKQYMEWVDRTITYIDSNGISPRNSFDLVEETYNENCNCTKLLPTLLQKIQLMEENMNDANAIINKLQLKIWELESINKISDWI